MKYFSAQNRTPDGANDLIQSWGALFKSESTSRDLDARQEPKTHDFLEYSFEPRSIYFLNASNTNPVASIEELVIDLNKRFQYYGIPVARFHFYDWWYDHKGSYTSQDFYSIRTIDWSEIIVPDF